MAVGVSIVIPAYNACDDFRTCLASLAQQTYRQLEVLWIDSASTDGSPDLVCAEFPWVRVVRSDRNLGYRGGARLGATLASGEFIIVMNQDVECAPRFVENLIQPMFDEPEIGITAPLILHFEDRSVVNEAGNAFHFSGLYGSRGLDEPRSRHGRSCEIGIVSGCCFCIRTDIWRRLGGFSDDFEAYNTGFHAGNEDQDLCWRARLCGYKVWLSADSELFHKFVKKPWSGGKLNSYFYSYWLVLLRNFTWRSLVVLSPFIVVNMCLLWLRGAVSGKGTSIMMWRTQLWIIRNWRRVLAMRRITQSQRKVPDHVVVQAMETQLSVSSNRGAQAAYSFLSTLYYAAFRTIIVIFRA